MATSPGSVKEIQDEPLNFFHEQPFDKLRSIFEHNNQELLKALPAITKIYQVGSSSIKGMPGMLAVDMVAIAPEWPLGEQILSQLSNLGWRYLGNSPHAGENGLWFHNGGPLEIENTTHKVSTVFHLVRTPELAVRFLAFREYCYEN